MLVTGGAGFMGSNFVRHLLAKGTDYEITVLDSLTYAGNLQNLNGCLDKVQFVHGSILDENLVDSLISKTGVIVNFAAETHNDNSLLDPEPFYSTNVMGTFRLAQAARKHSVRLHQISTDEVYGDLPLDSEEKFTEEYPFSPSSPYSASKAAADHLLLAWHRSFGLKVTISNSANNFGPNQNPEKLIPKSVESLRLGLKPKVYGSGLNVRDWIHVDDHTEAVLSILERGKVGHNYIVSASQLRSNLDVIGTLNQAFGQPANYIEFIEDRPGHDRKYASDSQKIRTHTGWAPKSESLETFLQKQSL